MGGARCSNPAILHRVIPAHEAEKQNLSPHLPTSRILLPVRAPRSEIMTSGWCVETGWGGSRVAPGRKHDGMIRFAGDAAIDAG